MLKFKPGHRCWMNPAVNWRCIGGRVFDLVGIVGRDLSPEDQRAITLVHAQLEAYCQIPQDIVQQPQLIRDTAEAIREQYQQKATSCPCNAAAPSAQNIPPTKF